MKYEYSFSAIVSTSEKNSRFQMKKIKCLDEKQLVPKAIILVFKASASQHLLVQHASCFQYCGLLKNALNTISTVLFFLFIFGILWSTVSAILGPVYSVNTLQRLSLRCKLTCFGE